MDVPHRIGDRYQDLKDLGHDLGRRGHKAGPLAPSPMVRNPVVC
jgi:hypothetical protein